MNKTLNGIEINKLVETINAVKQNPELAKFKFRTSTEWINGGYSRTKIQEFYGVGTRGHVQKRTLYIGWR